MAERQGSPPRGSILVWPIIAILFGFASGRPLCECEKDTHVERPWNLSPNYGPYVAERGHPPFARHSPYYSHVDGHPPLAPNFHFPGWHHGEFSLKHKTRTSFHDNPTEPDVILPSGEKVPYTLFETCMNCYKKKLPLGIVNSSGDIIPVSSYSELLLATKGSPEARIQLPNGVIISAGTYRALVSGYVDKTLQVQYPQDSEYHSPIQTTVVNDRKVSEPTVIMPSGERIPYKTYESIVHSNEERTPLRVLTPKEEKVFRGLTELILATQGRPNDLVLLENGGTVTSKIFRDVINSRLRKNAVLVLPSGLSMPLNSETLIPSDKLPEENPNSHTGIALPNGEEVSQNVYDSILLSEVNKLPKYIIKPSGETITVTTLSEIKQETGDSPYDVVELHNGVVVTPITYESVVSLGTENKEIDPSHEVTEPSSEVKPERELSVVLYNGLELPYDLYEAILETYIRGDEFEVAVDGNTVHVKSLLELIAVTHGNPDDAITLPNGMHSKSSTFRGVLNEHQQNDIFLRVPSGEMIPLLRENDYTPALHTTKKSDCHSSPKEGFVTVSPGEKIAFPLYELIISNSDSGKPICVVKPDGSVFMARTLRELWQVIDKHPEYLIRLPGDILVLADTYRHAVDSRLENSKILKELCETGGIEQSSDGYSSLNSVVVLSNQETVPYHLYKSIIDSYENRTPLKTTTSQAQYVYVYPLVELMLVTQHRPNALVFLQNGDVTTAHTYRDAVITHTHGKGTLLNLPESTRPREIPPNSWQTPNDGCNFVRITIPGRGVQFIHDDGSWDSPKYCRIECEGGVVKYQPADPSLGLPCYESLVRPDGKVVYIEAPCGQSSEPSSKDDEIKLKSDPDNVRSSDVTAIPQNVEIEHLPKEQQCSDITESSPEIQWAKTKPEHDKIVVADSMGRLHILDDIRAPCEKDNPENIVYYNHDEEGIPIMTITEPCEEYPCPLPTCEQCEDTTSPQPLNDAYEFSPNRVPSTKSSEINSESTQGYSEENPNPESNSKANEMFPEEHTETNEDLNAKQTAEPYERTPEELTKPSEEDSNEPLAEHSEKLLGEPSETYEENPNHQPTGNSKENTLAEPPKDPVEMTHQQIEYDQEDSHPEPTAETFEMGQGPNESPQNNSFPEPPHKPIELNSEQVTETYENTYPGQPTDRSEMIAPETNNPFEENSFLEQSSEPSKLTRKPNEPYEENPYREAPIGHVGMPPEGHVKPYEEDSRSKRPTNSVQMTQEPTVPTKEHTQPQPPTEIYTENPYSELSSESFAMASNVQTKPDQRNSSSEITSEPVEITPPEQSKTRVENLYSEPTNQPSELIEKPREPYEEDSYLEAPTQPLDMVPQRPAEPYEQDSRPIRPTDPVEITHQEPTLPSKEQSNPQRPIDPYEENLNSELSTESSEIGSREQTEPDEKNPYFKLISEPVERTPDQNENVYSEPTTQPSELIQKPNEHDEGNSYDEAPSQPVGMPPQGPAEPYEGDSRPNRPTNPERKENNSYTEITSEPVEMSPDREENVYSEPTPQPSELIQKPNEHDEVNSYYEAPSQPVGMLPQGPAEPYEDESRPNRPTDPEPSEKKSYSEIISEPVEMSPDREENVHSEPTTQPSELTRKPNEHDEGNSYLEAPNQPVGTRPQGPTEPYLDDSRPNRPTDPERKENNSYTEITSDPVEMSPDREENVHSEPTTQPSELTRKPNEHDEGNSYLEAPNQPVGTRPQGPTEPYLDDSRPNRPTDPERKENNSYTEITSDPVEMSPDREENVHSEPTTQPSELTRKPNEHDEGNSYFEAPRQPVGTRTQETTVPYEDDSRPNRPIDPEPNEKQSYSEIISEPVEMSPDRDENVYTEPTALPSELTQKPNEHDEENPYFEAPSQPVGMPPQGPTEPYQEDLRPNRPTDPEPEEKNSYSEVTSEPVEMSPDREENLYTEPTALPSDLIRKPNEHGVGNSYFEAPNQPVGTQSRVSTEPHQEDFRPNRPTDRVEITHQEPTWPSKKHSQPQPPSDPYAENPYSQLPTDYVELGSKEQTEPEEKYSEIASEVVGTTPLDPSKPREEDIYSKQTNQPSELTQKPSEPYEEDSYFEEPLQPVEMPPQGPSEPYEEDLRPKRPTDPIEMTHQEPTWPLKEYTQPQPTSDPYEEKPYSELSTESTGIGSKEQTKPDEKNSFSEIISEPVEMSPDREENVYTEPTAPPSQLIRKPNEHDEVNSYYEAPSQPVGMLPQGPAEPYEDESRPDRPTDPERKENNSYTEITPEPVEMSPDREENVYTEPTTQPSELIEKPSEPYEEDSYLEAPTQPVDMVPQRPAESYEEDLRPKRPTDPVEMIHQDPTGPLKEYIEPKSPTGPYKGNPYSQLPTESVEIGTKGQTEPEEKYSEIASEPVGMTPLEPSEPGEENLYSEPTTPIAITTPKSVETNEDNSHARGPSESLEMNHQEPSEPYEEHAYLGPTTKPCDENHQSALSTNPFEMSPEEPAEPDRNSHSEITVEPVGMTPLEQSEPRKQNSYSEPATGSVATTSQEPAEPYEEISQRNRPTNPAEITRQEPSKPHVENSYLEPPTEPCEEKGDLESATHSSEMTPQEPSETCVGNPNSEPTPEACEEHPSTEVATQPGEIIPDESREPLKENPHHESAPEASEGDSNPQPTFGVREITPIESSEPCGMNPMHRQHVICPNRDNVYNVERYHDSRSPIKHKSRRKPKAESHLESVKGIIEDLPEVRPTYTPVYDDNGELLSFIRSDLLNDKDKSVPDVLASLDPSCNYDEHQPHIILNRPNKIVHDPDGNMYVLPLNPDGSVAYDSSSTVLEPVSGEADSAGPTAFNIAEIKDRPCPSSDPGYIIVRTPDGYIHYIPSSAAPGREIILPSGKKFAVPVFPSKFLEPSVPYHAFTSPDGYIHEVPNGRGYDDDVESSMISIEKVEAPDGSTVEIPVETQKRCDGSITTSVTYSPKGKTKYKTIVDVSGDVYSIPISGSTIHLHPNSKPYKTIIDLKGNEYHAPEGQLKSSSYKTIVDINGNIYEIPASIEPIDNISKHHNTPALPDSTMPYPAIHHYSDLHRAHFYNNRDYLPKPYRASNFPHYDRVMAHIYQDKSNSLDQQKPSTTSVSNQHMTPSTVTPPDDTSDASCYCHPHQHISPLTIKPSDDHALEVPHYYYPPHPLWNQYRHAPVFY